MKEKTSNWWMCSECENVFQDEISPATCPSCLKKCTFVDVTCYIPECGGPKNVDTRLVAAKSVEARQRTGI
jgi:rubredoxin